MLLYYQLLGAEKWQIVDPQEARELLDTFLVESLELGYVLQMSARIGYFEVRLYRPHDYCCLHRLSFRGVNLDLSDELRNTVKVFRDLTKSN